MKYLLKTEKAACSCALALSLFIGVGDASADVTEEVDILECFELEYESESMTSQTAYDIAECFSGLADTIVESNSDEFIEDTALWVWDDKNVLLHYADSWFSFAAYKGHPDANQQRQLMQNSLKK